MPVNIWTAGVKEIYIGNQKVKEVYIGNQKVFGWGGVEYYFRNQEDIRRALKDQITRVEEWYVNIYNNTMRTQQRRFALPIGIANPKIVAIKGVIQNNEFGRLLWAQVGIGDYSDYTGHIYFWDGLDTRNRSVKIYSDSNKISLTEYGNTIINFTLTVTYLSSRYVWTAEMRKYSVKATGNIYNYWSNKSFTLESIREFNPFSPCFVFYLEDYAEIQIEYFKAQ